MGFSCIRSASHRFFSGLVEFSIFAGAALSAAAAVKADDLARTDQAVAGAIQVASGRDIFVREWLHNDPRAHGGDGLGPVFNDTSCVACHNLGGVGGGGPANKNVEIVSSISSVGTPVPAEPSAAGRFVRSMFGLGTGRADQVNAEALRQFRDAERNRLAGVHPGFRAASSVVLHRFGVGAAYAAWRQQFTVEHQRFGVNFNRSQPAANITDQDATPSVESDIKKLADAQQEILRVRSELGNRESGRVVQVKQQLLTVSRRNATALFGAGLLDMIPDRAIEAGAGRQYAGFPEISGRVSRLKDGRIGRFGWKAQKATLYDFTMTACAVELGLNVPEHPQSGNPLEQDYKPAGFDLNQEECNALVSYLKNLPRPEQRMPAAGGEDEYLAAGRAHFAAVGCAACHAPSLGEVQGVYSDLLVHDMGADLDDTGDYGAFIPDSADEVEEPSLTTVDASPVTTEPGVNAPVGATQEASVKIIGATRQEWRTPPLWGCRDSAPYMHDGRAETLEQAIAFHGGEGAGSAQRFFMLTPTERQQVLAFLKTLVAPQAR